MIINLFLNNHLSGSDCSHLILTKKKCLAKWITLVYLRSIYQTNAVLAIWGNASFLWTFGGVACLLHSRAWRIAIIIILNFITIMIISMQFLLQASLGIFLTYYTI